MQVEGIYDQCWSPADDLRQDLKKQDLGLIVQSVECLRAALATRTGGEDASRGQPSLVDEEQLDLLDAIAESLERALEPGRLPAHEHRASMRTAEYLLEHLAARRGLEFVLSN
jgi:hypothetical protein